MSDSLRERFETKVTLAKSKEGRVTVTNETETPKETVNRDIEEFFRQYEVNLVMGRGLEATCRDETESETIKRTIYLSGEEGKLIASISPREPLQRNKNPIQYRKTEGMRNVYNSRDVSYRVKIGIGV